MDRPNKFHKNIAIVGGGVTGIAAAIYLSQSSHFKVTLFEKSDSLGGLASYYQWEDNTWDQFYHVILPLDTVFLNLLHEIGLDNKLLWSNSKTGFYGDNRLVSMSSTLDFLRFPFMSYWQKLRMALGIILCSRIKDVAKLDRIYAHEWLTTIFGRRVYSCIWEPLLRSKLGAACEKTSAAFIWATINRLYSARQDSGRAKKERMGHIRGGYHTILSNAGKKLLELGVEIKKGIAIKTITPSIKEINQIASDEDIIKEKQKFVLHTESQDYVFDKVLLTVDCPQALKLIDSFIDKSQTYWVNLKKVEYLGIVCLFLVLKRKLSPYYVINLLDKRLPFTGIIETTNVVSPDEIDGKYIVYLPKYVTKDDAIKFKLDEEIKSIFINNLRKVFPHFDDRDILHSKVFRSECVQPLQEINFLNRAANIATPINGLYIANTSMIYNATLNNNAATKLAIEATKMIDDNCP
jgi:protoporphyrinogen oxidase